ncbi:MAG: hypothetical protein J2P16_07125, partial [Mycobacterium sp.]|nr:hypothetical protein [Mycobacterium sp.]
MSTNTFAIQKTRGPLARITAGAGLALAAIATIGLGAGIAGAAPQQPVLVDDPVPAPAPAGMDPNTAVNIANAIFGQLGSFLDSVFPGAGSLLTPASSATGGLIPGSTSPSAVSPGLTSPLSPNVPGYPSAVTPGQTLPGYPSTVTPGQTPGLPGGYP